jgi:hypothetical protein
VLKPFKQSVGFQEKHAVATLHRNQIRLPCGTYEFCLALGVLIASMSQVF